MHRAATRTRADAAKAAAAGFVEPQSSWSSPEPLPSRQIKDRSTARNQCASNPRTGISASARNKEKGKTDREQIFAHRNAEVVNVETVDQTSPDFVPEEGADHAACSTENSSGK